MAVRFVVREIKETVYELSNKVTDKELAKLECRHPDDESDIPHLVNITRDEYTTTEVQRTWADEANAVAAADAEANARIQAFINKL